MRNTLGGAHVSTRARMMQDNFQGMSLVLLNSGQINDDDDDDGVGLTVRAIISFQYLQLVGLRKTIIFPQDCVSAVQGHPRSLILVPIESAHATSY